MMKRLSGMLLLAAMLLGMPVWAEDTLDLCSKPEVEAGTDKTKFHYPNWDSHVELALNKVRNLWNPPAGKEGHVSVAFTINRQGQIIEMKICKSSGSKEFDRLALKAIKYASPFPRFPLGYKKETVDVKMNFDAGKEQL